MTKRDWERMLRADIEVPGDVQRGVEGALARVSPRQAGAAAGAEHRRHRRRLVDRAWFKAAVVVLVAVLAFGAGTWVTGGMVTPDNRMNLSETSESDSLEVSGDKVVYTASADIETTSYDEAQETLGDKVSEAGGIIRSRTENVEGGPISLGRRTLTVVVDVPADAYESFMAALPEVGTVVSSTSTARDKTGDYKRYKSQVAALEAEQERLEEQLSEAETDSEASQLESKITYVGAMLSDAESQLAQVKRSIEYSTVTVELDDVSNALRPGSGPSYWERLANGAAGALGNFVEGCALALLIAVECWPLLAIIAAIVCARALWKRHRRRRGDPPSWRDD
jgi:hypothetical protein